MEHWELSEVNRCCRPELNMPYIADLDFYSSFPPSLLCGACTNEVFGSFIWIRNNGQNVSVDYRCQHNHHNGAHTILLSIGRKFLYNEETHTQRCMYGVVNRAEMSTPSRVDQIAATLCIERLAMNIQCIQMGLTHPTTIWYGHAHSYTCIRDTDAAKRGRNTFRIF